MKISKLVTTFVCASALAAQTGDVLAATSATRDTTSLKRVAKTVTATVVGPNVKCHQWGFMTVRIKVQKTIVGTKVTKVKILSVDWPIYPDHTPKSKYINASALPLLRYETLKVQSAKLQAISGATNTTVSWEQSLQAALTQAHTA